MATFGVLQEVHNVGHLEGERLKHGNDYLCKYNCVFWMKMIWMKDFESWKQYCTLHICYVRKKNYLFKLKII